MNSWLVKELTKSLRSGIKTATLFMNQANQPGSLAIPIWLSLHPLVLSQILMWLFQKRVEL
jgi:hypothetical protein